MGDNGNLIDLISDDEAKKYGTPFTNDKSTVLEDPYDPFDSIEKEAFLKMLPAESSLKLKEDCELGFKSDASFQKDLANLRIPVLDTLNKSSCAVKSNMHALKLLQDLKILIRDDVQKSKIEKFDAIIEILNNTISKRVETNELSSDLADPAVCPTYKRQGTFDIDLENTAMTNNDKEMTDVGPDNVNTSEISYLSQVVCDAQQNKNLHFTKEVDTNFLKEITNVLENQNLCRCRQNSTQTNDLSQNGHTLILIVKPLSTSELPNSIVCPLSSRDVQSNGSQSIMRRRSSSLSTHNISKPFRGKNLESANDKEAAVSTVRQRGNSFSLGLCKKKCQSLTQSSNTKLGESIANSGEAKTIKKVNPTIKPLTTTIEKSIAKTSHDRIIPDTPNAARTFHTSTPMSQLRNHQRISLTTTALSGTSGESRSTISRKSDNMDTVKLRATKAKIVASKTAVSHKYVRHTNKS